MVQRTEQRNKQSQNANQEMNRTAHLPQLWREDTFLCVEDMENVISTNMVFVK